MIRLTRSELASSPALSRAAARLSAPPRAAAADYASTRAASSAWGSMRPDPVSAQHDKCGWCESVMDERAIEVDHIRPRSRQRYWWLAFDVDNLLAACRSCNNFKRDRWPLVTGARRLRPRESPRQVSERALVVDPTCEDPRRDLTFDFIGGRWRIAGTSDRGRETITVLELDRTTLTNNINDHARDVLDPLVHVLNGPAAQDREGFMAAGRSLAAYASPHRKWSAFSRHVLQEAVAGRYRP